MNKKHAEQLYQIVPALYREKDTTDDLEHYFDACGVLLDQVHATLIQRLGDNFPDNPSDDSAACQDWLLPYFAQLLDVQLISPSVKGRRDEVANAVHWRQGKGTLRIVEEIAQDIGQWEAVTQEGYKRVATTARINVPFLPATLFGYEQDIPETHASIAARNPGLPAVTVDFRCPSGAVVTDVNNPAAQSNTVDGATYVWRQASYHGVPCVPGSFDDVSRRTVDLRNSNWQQGHVHPRKLILYTAPVAGFFQTDLPRVTWSETPSLEFLKHISIIKEENKTIYRNKTLDSGDFRPVKIRRVIKLGQQPDGVGEADFHTWRFEGLILENTLEADSGRVELEKCAARRVEVHSIDYDEAVITAKDCLIKYIQAARGVSNLEYCTVLETTLTEFIYASECIFLGLIHKDHPTLTPPEAGCIRRSAMLRTQQTGAVTLHSVTTDMPVIFSTSYGERSCGVLHPATALEVRHGAEDGGEMGCYHFLHLSLLDEAVREKACDYLPVGLEAVVMPDEQLLNISE